MWKFSQRERERDRALLAPRKLFLPKRNYCQLPTVDFCLACLGFCPTDGYYYFVQVCGVAACIPPRYECVFGAGAGGAGLLLLLLCNWSSAANLLAGNLNYLCRSDHGYGSWMRVPATSYAPARCPLPLLLPLLCCLPMAKRHLFLLTFWQLSALQTRLGVCVCEMCVCVC